MGAAVIAVVFLAGLIGVPSIFGHGDAHAKSSAPQQPAATVQAPTQVAAAGTGAPAAVVSAAIDRP